ncbi:MAG: hypothetical protein KVP17_000415 [Porospora cf. gigantea B]|nr:MAG: hypothetical protein KVP17_000415 [Porospora cf. gigantea B]
MYGLVPSAECQRPPPTEYQRAEAIQEDSVTVHSVKEPEPQDYVLPPPSVAAETGVHGHWDYYKPLEAAYVEGIPMGKSVEDDFERWNQFYQQHPGTFECAPEQSRPPVQEDREQYSENFYSPNDLDDDFVPAAPAFVVDYELTDAAYAEEAIPAQEDWQLSPPEFSRPAFPEFHYQRDDESEGSCELPEQEAFERRLLEQEQIYKQQAFLQQLQEEDEANKRRLPYCCVPTAGNTQALNTTQHVQAVAEPETVEESQRDSTASLSSLPAVSTELAPASLAEIAPPGTDVYCLTNANHRTIELIRRPKFVKRSRREVFEAESEVRSPEVDMDHEWNEFMEIMESTDKHMKDWVTQPESTQVPSMGSFHVPELLPPDARAT